MRVWVGGRASERGCVYARTRTQPTGVHTCTHTHARTHRPTLPIGQAARGLRPLVFPRRCWGRPLLPQAGSSAPGQARRVAGASRVWEDLQAHGPRARWLQASPGEPPAAPKSRCSTEQVKMKDPGSPPGYGGWWLEGLESHLGDPNVQPEHISDTTQRVWPTPLG